ncbi:MAG: carbamoyltransferase C-terminal domain-containing protein [Candidatus Eisenbacteria bacterium]
MNVLGINAYHGDASAAMISDGQLVAAAEEERFTRIKHTAGFPYNAVRYCVEAAGLKPEEIDHIAMSRNPSAHIHKKILFACSRLPSFDLIKNRLANAIKIADAREQVARALTADEARLRCEVHNVEHHRAHLASSYFVSGFDEAAVLSVDGFGDFVSAMWGLGRGNSIGVTGWIEFPHSLGLAYTAVTQFLGFPKYGDEYKVMGLASYGEPAYMDEFRELIKVGENGVGYRLNLPYFVHHREGVTMTWEEGPPILGSAYSDKMTELLGPPRDPGADIEKRHQDIAASLQAMLEIAVLNMLSKIHSLYGVDKLCMAGGVALNCVLNGKILSGTPFRQVYIQPASHDGGTSLGAAYWVWHQILGRPRDFAMEHVYWGPGFGDGDIANAILERSDRLTRQGCLIRKIDDLDELCRWTAGRVADGKVVGWFQGRTEWGPRALGNRSIVVDPRKAEMKDVLNSRIKRRESFRPFAPSVLEEAQGAYFKDTCRTPFMLMSCDVIGKEIPAVTHVDGTARPQTVSKSINRPYWQLIKEFEKLTGVPVVLNTSFNENEPIVCTPGEAIECFLRTKMDVLVMGSRVLYRGE